MKGFIITSVILVAVSIIVATQFIGYHNRWTDVEAKYIAQVDNDKVIYDNLWKVISQQAKVSEKYSEDFKNNYKSIMESRNYGGEMMKWITEHNPEFTPDLYKQLMNTIDSKRTEFTANQKLLISYHQELYLMKNKFPSNLFCYFKTLPELQIVTSSKTEETFETLKENDVEVF